ncbi:MAG: hypothetical protein M1815_005581 [Lichina confinis]|nr:MAG: hypothetical protein M1815_005581 [Lichina confinis]
MANNREDSVDAMINRLWRVLDAKGRGEIDAHGLRRGLRKIDHPLKDADDLLRHVFEAVDINGDGTIVYEEFRDFVRQTEQELRILFDGIDRDHNGQLDKAELREAFARAGLVVSNAKLDQFFAEVDVDRNGVISFDEWRDFLLFIPVDRPSLSAVLSYYSAAVTLTPEGDVQLGNETIQGLGRDPFSFLLHQYHAQTPPAPHLGLDRCPRQPRGSHKDWARFWTRPPHSSLAHQPQVTMDRSAEIIENSPLDPLEAMESMLAGNFAVVLKPALTSVSPDPGYFVAGGMAGFVSRTATAPLDRLKVYLIAQTGVTRAAADAVKQGAPLEATKKATRPLVEASKALWRAGGIRSLFAGNGLNVVKIMPESAIKFGSYEASSASKRAFARFEGDVDPKQLGSVSKFLAGGVAGLISQAVVYPIDTLKFRMQCETVEGGLRGNRLIANTAMKMLSTSGIRAFYKGLPMGLVGVFPYAAIDLGTFEYLKRTLTRRNARRRGCHEDDALLGSFATAGIGAVSGTLGASIVYPLNLLRTRLQAQGTAIHPATYTGILDVTRKTVSREGIRGLFKGLTPNLLKVVPAVSISYVVYEHSKRLLSLS